MRHHAAYLDEYLPPIPDDTEEAPWMVLSTVQWDATNALYDSLALHAQSFSPPWLVRALLGIRYPPNPPDPHRQQLAPDIMVAFVPDPDRPRSTYDVEEEGIPPAFVLEVVSAESRRRDVTEKPPHYERMGVREYALFAPPGGAEIRERRRLGFGLLNPPLQGYRRSERTGRFQAWELDEAGRLYSRELGLWLMVQGSILRAQTEDRTLLPTLWELDVARRRAEAAQRQAESMRDAEATARRQAEAEVARLRAELERRRSE